jgi:hypothetical protein
MIERLFGLCLAVTLALPGCGSGISVRSDWDPAVDFSGYHTFAVLDEAEGDGRAGPLTDQRIRAAITSTLEARGMRKISTADEADVAVGWQFTTDQRTSYRTVNTGWSG